MRAFRLVRDEDHSGISGIGYVAEGVQFTDGTCAMRWTTHTCSTCLYATYDDLVTIHGHNGSTHIEWTDTPVAAEQAQVSHYVSTYCIHRRHDECRLTCKLCESPCRCDCHPEPDA
jgi:hypothetical protein